MKDIEARLVKIQKGLEKFLSLHQEQQSAIKKLTTENQELASQVTILKRQLDEAKETGAKTLKLNNENNLQNKQEINNKIDELLSEVERCVTLLKGRS